MSVKKKLVTSVKRTILTSAIFHLILLAIYAIQTGNMKLLNLFNILDLDLYFPTVIQGTASDILAFITLLVVLGAYFFFS